MGTRTVSNVAIVLVVLLASAATLAGALATPSSFATFGLKLAWRSHPNGARTVSVLSVAPTSAAARAGLVAGDNITAFGSTQDRIALMVQSNIKTGFYLAPGQSATFTITRGRSAIVERIVAGETRSSRPRWLILLRTFIYVLGALLAAALVLWRPERITWGFALFVILAQQPNIPYLELAGRIGTPLEFLALLFLTVPCAIAAGSLGLLAFGARFPERVPSASFRRIERAVQILVACAIAAFAEWYIGQLYGLPTFDRAQLVDAINYLPELTAIGMLAHTLLTSRGEKRIRLSWAIVGPSLGTVLTLVDIRLVAIGTPYAYGVAFGMLASIAPFSMMYAILRHRVIDIGLALNQTVAEAIVLTKPAGVKLDRRDLVRRVALLLAGDLPLHDTYPQLVSLLARFVDASSVLLVRGNAQRARLEYNFEGGAGARPDDVAIPPESIVGGVLQTGNAILFRQAQDWPSVRRVSVRGQATIVPESAIFVPVKFAGVTLGVISVQSQTPEAYQDEDLRLLETCALYLGARIHDDDDAEKARGTSSLPAGHDALTGLPGHALFDEALIRAWSSVSPLAVLLVDVDLFSAFNATYGHVAADVCLREVAAAIASAIENRSGFVSRYGTEGFAVLLPSLNADEAARAAEEIRTRIYGSAIAHEGSSIGALTASVGLASMVTSVYDDPQSIVTLANLQLNAAKQRGGNRAFGEGYESHAPPVHRCGVAKSSLPVPTTTFVGCEAAVTHIEHLLEQHRLVTITGGEGVGKTRLALEAARRSDTRFPDGVWYVDLSDLDDGALLAQTVAYRLFPGLDVETDNARLAELLRDRSMLLILDDCTHILNYCARLADVLLTETSGVSIIATSHALMGIDREGACKVNGLANDDALMLLRARRPTGASDIDEAQVVNALRGSPLMIQIAATLSNPMEAINDGGSLLDWVYRSMSDDQQCVLARLSALGNGWTFARAAAICATETLPHEKVEEVLQTLAQRSLISRVEVNGLPQYGLSTTIRDFAGRHLHARGDTSMPQAHLQFFAGYARDVRKRKNSLSFQRWSELQLAELSDYRRALRYASSDPTMSAFAVDIFRSLRGVLRPLASSYDIAAHLRELLRRNDFSEVAQGAFWLALAELERLSSPQNALRAARRAVELLAGSDDAGDIAHAAWRLANAQLTARGEIERQLEPALVAALAVAKQAPHKQLAVGLLRSLAILYSDQGRHDEARQGLREAAFNADPTDTASLAELLASSALEEFRIGNMDGALAMWRQSAALDEEDRPTSAALCFVSIGRCELARGDLLAARIALRKGLIALKSAGFNFGIAYGFDYLTRLAKQSGDNYRAARIAGFASAMYERGAARPKSEEPQFYLLLDQLRSALGQRAFDDEWNRGHFFSIEEAMLEAKAA